MLGSNPGLLRLRHWQSDTLTSWLDLIQNITRSQDCKLANYKLSKTDFFPLIVPVPVLFCKEPIPKQIFLEKELRGHSPSFRIHVSVSDLCIPTIDLSILLQEICGQILGIYKSLTDWGMWKLGLRLRNSQKRNTSTGFSLQCLQIWRPHKVNTSASLAWVTSRLGLLFMFNFSFHALFLQNKRELSKN